MRTRICSLILFLVVCFPTLSGAQEKPKPEQVEVHEGLFGMVSYFGSKLVDELSTRLNLSEPDSTETLVPTKVVVKVGGMGFTRTEMRAKEND